MEDDDRFGFLDLGDRRDKSFEEDWLLAPNGHLATLLYPFIMQNNPSIIVMAIDTFDKVFISIWQT
jgi:hypothetical protein